MACVFWSLMGVGVMSLAGAGTAFRGLRSSDDELRRMARLIGTRNPRLARWVCRVALVVLSVTGFVLLGGGGWFLLWGLLG